MSLPPSSRERFMIPAAVIFDLDGTLADTLLDLADATNWALTRHGLPVRPVEDYRRLVGSGAAHWIAALVPAERTDLTAPVLAAMRERYRSHPVGHTRLYEGIPELLDVLVARGIRLAVLSNKHHEATVALCAELLARWPFAIIRGASAEVPLKPDPRGALAIAADLEIAPREFAYLGDTAIDMQTATAAGMVAIGALWGFRDAAELEAGGARALLARPGDLLAALARL
jgi:phosphoglycolate phosphatase